MALFGRATRRASNLTGSPDGRSGPVEHSSPPIAAIFPRYRRPEMRVHHFGRHAFEEPLWFRENVFRLGHRWDNCEKYELDARTIQR